MTSEPSMPMGMSRCGFLRFLRRHAHRIEADIGEEDHAGGAEHAGPAEMSERAGVGRNEGHMVGGHDVEKPTKITTSTMRELDRHHHVVEIAPRS